MRLQLLLGVLGILQGLLNGGDAWLFRRIRPKKVRLTILSSDCQKPVEGTKLSCRYGTINPKFISPGVYEFKTNQLPVKIKIAKAGFVTIKHVIRKCSESVTLRCEGQVCTTENVTVRVTSDCVAVVQSAVFKSPDILASTSPSPGVYELSVCKLPVTVNISKFLYVPQSKTFTSNTETVNLMCRRQPYIVEHPQSKWRSIGEDAKLCCWADSLQQTELSFKWYFDGIEIEGETEMSLMITDIQAGDAGKYKCAASITMGDFTQAVMSDEATLTIVPDSSNHNTQLRSRLVTILGTCQVDIGFCRPVPCRTAGASDLDCVDDGYVCPQTTETKVVDCGVFGAFPIQTVTDCTCCSRPPLKVIGMVSGFGDGLPIAGAEVKILAFGISLTTDANGKFTGFAKPETRRIVIEVVKDGYLSALSVFRVDAGFLGEVDANIVMFKRDGPVVIDANVDNTLSISKDPLNNNIGAASLVIPKNSFFKIDGSPHTGNVNTFITAIPASDRAAIGNAPGEFITYDNDGNEQTLTTQLVFEVKFQDFNGNPLRSRPLTVVGDLTTTLWGLDGLAAVWVAIIPGGGRRKREVMLGQLGQIDTEEWDKFNIDKFGQQKQCWIKTRMFDEDTLTELTTPDSFVIYRPQIEIFQTNPEEYLPLKQYHTTDPSKVCFEVRCDEDPDDVSADTLGTIGMKLNYYNADDPKTAKPVILDEYPEGIKQDITDTGFLINDKDEIEAKFYSSGNGPFYDNLNTCEASLAAENHFRFMFKPPTLSDPDADTNKRCYARVEFTGDSFFLNIVDSLDPKPPGEAASAWTKNGEKVYKDTDSEFTEDGNSRIYCLKYRCSEDASMTTVSLGSPIGLEITYMCDVSTFTPPVSPGAGYFIDETGMDDNAKLACEQDISDEFAFTSSCLKIFIPSK